MRAVFALLQTYFGATTLGRQVSLVSAIFLAIGFGSRMVYPEFAIMFQTGYMPDTPPALQFLIAVVPVLGIFGLFFGTFMLPVVLAQISSTRRLHALPHGRAKVIVSAIACVVIVALACTLILGFYVPPALRDDFRTFSAALAGYTMLYGILWLIARSRTAFGRLSAGMLLIAALAIPAWLAPRTDTAAYVIATVLLWSVVGAAIGRPARSDGSVARFRSRFMRHAAGDGHGAVCARASEHERVDALVGTARPWLVALSPVLPAAIAVFFVPPAEGWLFYLTLFAMLSGAIASLAARRSRALWLRTQWSRDEIFARLERAFWRQNSCALTVLALAHAAICIYFSLPLRTGLLGALLLALATASSTYLGFMMTRRIHWAEVPLLLVTMILVMTSAVSISDAAMGPAWAIAQMLVLVAATLAFRVLARRRWHGIDWALTQSQPEYS
jgi:hypothetical protein